MGTTDALSPSGAVSARLHQLWVRAGSPSTPLAAAQLPVPGRLALRCRYELLTSGHTVGAPAGLFAITERAWREQLADSDRGQQALEDNDTPTAREAFNAVIDAHDRSLHPLPLIDALIGLADADRQDENTCAALRNYARALPAAKECRYTYGQVRAGIALGYLHLRVSSAQTARDEFAAAAAIADRHDWRIERANALTGLGEAHQRLDKPFEAMKALLAALSIFDVLKSSQGIANATMQLGEVCRRRMWLDDAEGWYRQAVGASAGLPIAMSNALDGLGEIHLATGDHDAAVADHTAAMAAAGPTYPRGRAHAITGLARCAVAVGDWRQAITHFASSAQLYAEIDDLPSAATTLTGLARCHYALGDIEESLHHRLEAWRLIETARAAQPGNEAQSEYFERYSNVYEMALRVAVEATDPHAFLAVFESIAGRRLAGLMTGVAEDSSDARLLAQLVLEADARAGERRSLTRALGSVGLRAALPGLARDAFHATLAALYSPFDIDQVDALWNQVDTGDAYLLLVAALRRPTEVVWLLKPPEGPVHMGLNDLDDDAARLVDELHSRGLPLQALPADVAALSGLLPAVLLELIEPDAPLTVVPAGRLWAVPWAAAPVSPGEYLGERNALCVAPSLNAVAHSCGGQREPPGAAIAHWTSPAVCWHRFDVYRDATTPTTALRNADECRNAILNADHDVVAVLSHGRPVRDLVHYLELDEDTALTPSDMLHASPPPTLVLIACWGAHAPDQGWGDPLSIATLALAQGSTRIAATTSELLDDGASSHYINMFLYAARQQPLPRAHQIATRRWLSKPEYRGGYLSRWAPLTMVGAW